MSGTHHVLRAIVAFSLAVTGLAPAVSGEEATPEPVIENGFSADKLYQYDSVDTVDLSAGTVQLTIPIGHTYPVGPALSFGLTLVYSSSVWTINSRGPAGCGGEMSCDFEAVPNALSNAGLGWRLSLGQLFDPADTDNPLGQYWVYVSADGAQHRLWPTLHDGETTGTAMYTRDGTYLRASRQGTATDTWLLETGDGITHTFVNHTGVKWRLAAISWRGPRQ